MYAAFRGFKNEEIMTRILNTAVSGAVAMECDILEALRMPDQIQWFADMNPFLEVAVLNQILYLDGGRYLFIRRLTAEQRIATYYCEVVSSFVTVRAPTSYQLTGVIPGGNLTEYIPSMTIQTVIGEPVTYVYAATFVSTSDNVDFYVVSCPSFNLPPSVTVTTADDVVLTIMGLSGDERTGMVTIVCNIVGTSLSPPPILELSFLLSSKLHK